MKCESCGAVLKEAKCDYCGTISTSYQTHINVNVEPIIDAINNANQLQKKQAKTQELMAPVKAEIEKQIRDQTQAKIKKEIEDRVASQIKKEEKPVISKSIKNDRIPIQFWRYGRFWGLILALIIYALYWIKLVNAQWSTFSRNWGISLLSFSMAYRPSVIILIVSFMMGTIFIKLLKIGKLLTSFKWIIRVILILELYFLISDQLSLILNVYFGRELFLVILVIFSILVLNEIKQRRKQGISLWVHLMGTLGLISSLLMVEFLTYLIKEEGFILNANPYVRGTFLGILALLFLLSLFEIIRRRKAGIYRLSNLKGVEDLNPKLGLTVLDSADKIKKNKVGYETALIALTSANIPLEGAKCCLEGRGLEIDIEYIKLKLSNPKGIVKNFSSVSPVQLEPSESNFEKNLEEIRENESPKVTPPPLPNISMAPTPQPAVELIDLNQASESDIATLPRINLILAKKIVQTREQLGGFTNFEQFVQEVNLPDNTAEAIKNQVTFSKIERKIQPTRGRMVDY